MNKLIAIPSAISSVRIAALPLFLYLYSLGSVAACLGLVLACAASDYFDGYAARKLNTSSRLGAYYDAATDFTLMFGIFVAFYVFGLYPVWLPLLIAAAFIQFLITSRYTRKLYDPVGRYLGSALYIGVALTLLWPTAEVLAFVQYAFVGFLVLSIASRVLSLTWKKPKNPKLK